MTDKEFRHLSRSELVEIIYRLQTESEALQRENAELKEQLADKEIKMNNVGSVAEAALQLNGVFDAAQAAADQYVKEVERIYGGARGDAERLLIAAKQTAEAIIRQANAESARIKAQTERDVEAKKAELDDKVKDIFRTHAELEQLLKIIKEKQ